MREIKFRYTCVRQNGYVFHKDFTLDEIDRGKAEQWRQINVTHTGALHKRQFTGRYDKNQKPIYEGDIVKRQKMRYDDDMEKDPWHEDEISFIEYRENGFWVESEDFGYEGEGLWDWDQMEIIGNIYENPDLLK